MWEKVAEGASPGYTCYVSRKTMRKKMSNLHQMLKKSWRSDPTEANKLFDISRDDIDQRFCVEDYNFIRDQKGLYQATFGGKGAKLAKKLKRKLSREKEFEKRKASKQESVSARQLHPLHGNASVDAANIIVINNQHKFIWFWKHHLTRNQSRPVFVGFNPSSKNSLLPRHY